MKNLLLILLFINTNLIKAEDSISITLRNNKVPLFSAPKFTAKKLKYLEDSADYKIAHFDEIYINQTFQKGIWINLIEPEGWVFSNFINIELDKEDNCSEKFSLPAKLNFGSFDIIFLKSDILFLSSFELGSSFSQQIGYWKWKKDRIEGNIHFEDSTLIDCLNICSENKNIQSCKKQCKNEISNEFGKENAEAKIFFTIKFTKLTKTIKFSEIKESNIKKKSYLKYLGFEKNKTFKAKCLEI